MSKELKVTVTTMGGEQHEIETPSDIKGGDLIHNLCIALNLPTRDAEEHAINWRLDDEDTGRTIDHQHTLSESDVQDGHRLHLIRAVVAGCFPKTAQVLLPTGDTIPIGEVRSGDDIMAYDIEMDGYVSGKVDGIYQQSYSEQIILNNYLITTPDQHILMADRSWRLAGDITAGDILLKFPFGQVRITDVQKTKGISSMFSLTLKYPLSMVVENIVVRDLIGKQAYLPKAVDVFLSYATADKDEARVVFDVLEKEEVSVFLAERSIGAGEFWEDRIKEALKNCRSFWILVTPNSLHSEWVITEWATAWALDKKIIPILFRCRPEDLPKRLQAYQCIDFHHIKKAIDSIKKRL